MSLKKAEKQYWKHFFASSIQKDSDSGQNIGDFSFRTAFKSKKLVFGSLMDLFWLKNLAPSEDQNCLQFSAFLGFENPMQDAKMYLTKIKTVLEVIGTLVYVIQLMDLGKVEIKKRKKSVLVATCGGSGDWSTECSSKYGNVSSVIVFVCTKSSFWECFIRNPDCSCGWNWVYIPQEENDHYTSWHLQSIF